jgi:hypothetical protein
MIVSFGEKITSNQVSPVPLADVIEDIRSGRWKSEIEEIGCIEDKKERNRRKREVLPYITPAGVFSQRMIDKWEKDSGTVVLDIDVYDINENIKLKNEVSMNPCVLACFLSPSGGLKILFSTQAGGADEFDYRRRWDAVKGMFLSLYEVDVDESGKDPSRACYVSHDPDAYFNEDAEPWEIPEDEWKELGEDIEKDWRELDKEWRDKELPPSSDRIQRYLDKISSVDGNHGSAGLMQACRAVVSGFNLSEPDQWQEISQWNRTVANPPWSDDELRRGLENARKQPSRKEEGWLNRDDGPEAKREELELVPVDADALMFEHPEMKPPIIDGFMRLGETCNVIAAPKTGKSWLVLQMAFSVANGEKFLGRRTEQKQVLLVDNELHPQTLADRLGKVSSSLGMSAENIKVLSLRGRLAPLGNLKSRLIEASRNMGAGLIILDALYRLLPEGVSENDNSSMTMLYNDLDQIALGSGASVVVVHHTSKGGQADKGITDGGAGAGAISRASDCHILIREHEEEGAVSLHAVSRSFPPPSPMVAMRNDWILVEAPELDPEKMKGRRLSGRATNSKPPSADEVMPPRLGHPVKRKDFITQMREDMGLTEDHASLGLSRSEDAGRLRTMKGPRGVVLVAHPDEPEQGTQADKARAYIRENQETSPKKVAQETGVSQKTVKRVLEEMGQKGEVFEEAFDKFSDLATTL